MRAGGWIAALVAVALVCACAGPQPVAPVEKRATTRSVQPAKPARVAPRPIRRNGDDRPTSYIVQRGDTLYAIALDFGFDYRDVAAWNDISDPGLIQVGRPLRLTPPVRDEVPETRAVRSSDPVTAEALGGPAPARSIATETRSEVARPPATGAAQVGSEPKATPPVLTEPQARTVRYSEQALAQLGGKPAEVGSKAASPKAPPAAGLEPKVDPGPVATPPKPAPAPAPEVARDTDDHVDWLWPAKGELLYRFGDSGKLKGIGVGGKSGQPIVAAGAGKVVYAGAGLRGYGKLVIVKHNDTFLSVYAHNSALVVKEGDSVRRGQKIAEMGDSDAARVGLHFEIRRFGKPLDPLAQLPRGAETPG